MRDVIPQKAHDFARLLAAPVARDPKLVHIVALALEEDLAHGDWTTAATVEPTTTGIGHIVARESLVLSGMTAALEVFRQVDPELEIVLSCEDGHLIAANETILSVRGVYRSILGAERCALNFLGRLSGIATRTRLFVERVVGTAARVVDTRKTTPGLRFLEKAAVVHGGGHNHRFNLSDGILIKDNHIVAAGGVRQALERAKTNVMHHLLKIEIEVDTLDQLQEALEVGADAILLDNMSPSLLERAVSIARGKALLEASGGVNLDTIYAVARTGVDLISVGSLIHGARTVDIGLDLEPISDADPGEDTP